MGRSMSVVTKADHVEKVATPLTVVNPFFDLAYTVYRSGANLYQREHEYFAPAASNGTTEHKLEYVIGSGLHGQTFLVTRGGYLFQAPLSFYSRSQRWALSPGYELVESGFNRPITRACLTCHSSTNALLAGRGLQDGPSRAVADQELAIGCENCHGPGQRHVAERRQHIKVTGGHDTSIVNPARLPSQLSEDICMNCHQGNDVRILQPGRDFSDFRPGRPLREVLAIFAMPPTATSLQRSDLLDQHFSIKASTCYQASGGRFTCLTCHNPHVEVPVGSQADYYRGKCLTCHKETSCALPVAERSRRQGTDNCTACHMPKRDLAEVPHTALTNHRIAHEGAPFPRAAFSLTPELPDLIYVNGPPNHEREPLAREVLYRAYGELAGRRPEYLERYLLLRNRR